MNQKWVSRTLVAATLSGLLLYTLIQFTGVETLDGALKGLTVQSFLVWMLIYMALILTRALRFQVALSQCSLVSLGIAIGIQGGLNRIIPFRLAELSLPYLLKRQATVETASVLFALLWIRIIELMMTLVFLGIGLLGYLDDSMGQVRVLIIGGLGLLLLLLLIEPLGLVRPPLEGTLQWLGRRMNPSTGVGHLLNRLLNELRGLSPLGTKARLRLVGWSVLVHALIFVLYYDMMAKFGAEFSLSALLVGVTGAQLVSVLPMLTIGSIGLHELGWVSGFVFCGMAADVATKSGVMTQVSTLLLALLFAALSSLFYRVSLVSDQ